MNNSPALIAGFFLNGINMISRCCKQDVFAMVDYYTCSVCHFPCGIFFDVNNTKDYINEQRHESQVESAFNQT